MRPSIYAFLMTAILSSLSSLAAAKGAGKDQFPSGPLLNKKVRFWEQIFTTYASTQMVIHDKDSPDFILGVVDLAKKTDAKGTIQAYVAVLKDFESKGVAAKKLSPLHKKIWTLYRKDEVAASRLTHGRVELRTQIGLSDTFHEAALRAQLYLPRMEKIFRDEGLPIELTRLPFVESMFNVKARSKVGAVGLWQLMPDAASPHIAVSRSNDERKSPILATRAAAKILKSNYSGLQSWPLAVTAYNHGANGVKRGVKKIGSTNLADLILSYRSPSFGFASQNFYASFLAAQNTYRHWHSKQVASASR